VGGDRLGRAHAAEAPVPAQSLDALYCLRPERSRVGIEPEYDATAALLNERRKPVTEMSRTP
jgi:hypothetical protein